MKYMIVVSISPVNKADNISINDLSLKVKAGTH